MSDCACADGCRQCRVRPTVNTVSIGNKGAFYAHIKASMASLRDVRAAAMAIRPYPAMIKGRKCHGSWHSLALIGEIMDLDSTRIASYCFLQCL